MTPAARRLLRIVPLLALLGSAGGCGLLFGGSPSSANIKLRKENEDLRQQIKEIQQQLTAREAEVTSLRERTPSLPTLADARLSKLFTTHSLKLGRLTGGWDRDPRTPGDEGLIIHASPLDEDGQAIKAAGTFTVEAFDLAEKETLVGKWKFDLASARKSWRGNFLDYNYVLQCPWKERRPRHPELTVKVTFLDELTQTPFHAQQVAKVVLPATTQPAGATRETVTSDHSR
jgi:hypothetical protein